MSGYIYLLYVFILSIPLEYEKQFKIGCTSKPIGRFENYSTYLGGKEYTMYFIKIIKVPYILRKRFHSYVKKGELYEYAEIYLHSIYNNIRINNPSSKRKTEFFTTDILPDIKDIESHLKNANIEYSIESNYLIDKNTFKNIQTDPNHEFNECKGKSKSKSKDIKKPKFQTDPNEEKRIIEKYIHKPILFFTELILFNRPLRAIQRELWDTLLKMTDFNGIIKWPTGTGKRIAIMMLVINIYIKSLTSKNPIRIAIVSNKNDIFEGNPWNEYKMLEVFGINVVKAFDGKFSKLKLNDKQSYLIVVTHQAVINMDEEIHNIKNLNLDALIYDEVQNITGNKLYNYLKQNKPRFLLGLSFTEYTDDVEQNTKLDELFNKKYISTCNFDRAISEGWINKCIYSIFTYDNNTIDKNKIIDIIKFKIQERITTNNWKTKKIIAWVPEGNLLVNEYRDLIKKTTDWIVFDNPNDEIFKQPNNTDKPYCLILYQQAREGYDRNGMEFGFTIGSSKAHLYVQQMGRVQRIDYENQLAELLIFTHKNHDEINEIKTKLNKYMNSTDYIDPNIYSIEDYKTRDCKSLDQEYLDEMQQVKQRYLQEMKQIKQKKDEEQSKQINDVIKLNQQICEAKQKEKIFESKSIIEKYKQCKKENLLNKIIDPDDYKSRKGIYYIDNPKKYFEECWISWYDFLGIDDTMPIEKFKQNTKELWIQSSNNITIFKDMCKKNNLPYFDYEGLYKSIPDNIFFEIDNGRRK